MNGEERICKDCAATNNATMKVHQANFFVALVGILVVSALAHDRQSNLIRMPPSITQGPPHQVSFTSGQSITLPCIALGIPEPVFEWYQNGVVVDKNIPGIVWDKGSLTINETTANFVGEWQCFAGNMHGKSMSAPVQLVMNSIGYYPPGQSVRIIYASPGGNA